METSISLDYIIRNNDSLSAEERNPYIDSFCKQPWLPQIRELCSAFPPIRKVFNHKQLKKEITESWAAVTTLEKLLTDKIRINSIASPVAPSSFPSIHELSIQRKIRFYDICCGKGITSVLIGCLFPEAIVSLIDFDASIDREYLSAPQFSHLHALFIDIHSQAFFDYLKQETDSDIRNGVLSCGLGLHLCGTLSNRVVSLFNELPSFSALVLAPCCMARRSKKSTVDGTRNMLRANQWNPHSYFCMMLYTQLDGAVCHKNISQDEHMLSDKSTFINAIKRTHVLEDITHSLPPVAAEESRVCKEDSLPLVVEEESRVCKEDGELGVET